VRYFSYNFRKKVGCEKIILIFKKVQKTLPTWTRLHKVSIMNIYKCYTLNILWHTYKHWDIYVIGTGQTLKFVSLVTLTVQNAMVGLSMRYSRTRAGDMFLSSTGKYYKLCYI